MSDAHIEVLDPSANLAESFAMSLFCTFPFVLFWVWIKHRLGLGWFSGAIFVGLTIMLAGAIWKLGWHEPPENPGGYVMIRTRLKRPTHKIYAAAQLWGIPALHGFAALSIEEHKIDPPVFDELAADDVNVYIDGYCVVATVDPFKYYLVHGSDEIIEKSFVANTRKFVSPWKKAIYVTDREDIVATFLKLPPKNDPHAHSEHSKFRQELQRFTQMLGPDGDRYLEPQCVDEIMKSAGNFKADAASYGIEVRKIDIEDMDLSEDIIKAASEATAAASKMAVIAIHQKQRMQMVDEMRKKDPSLSMKDAIDRVDRLMPNVNVSTDIRDINLTGVDGIGQAATVIAGIMGANKSNQPQKGNKS